MKTYLFDTFNRYKRFSEELDAKTILCNKSWWVFNDSGEKEVYIFNTDGTLIIAVSGKVTNATWQYITANKSLIITGNNQSYMVHPAFFDNQIFALQVDGTNDYAFLIDENNLPSTNLRSLADLKEHFAEKERQAVLAEERKRQAEIAALMHKQYEEELERQRLAKEAEEKRIRAEKEADNRIKNIIRKKHFYYNISDDWWESIDILIPVFGILSAFGSVLMCIDIFYFVKCYFEDSYTEWIYRIDMDFRVLTYLSFPILILYLYLFFTKKIPLSDYVYDKFNKEFCEYKQQHQKG